MGECCLHLAALRLVRLASRRDICHHRAVSGRRTSLLFHWTGKNIALDPETLTDETRASYLSMLVSILSGGLWLSSCHEMIQVSRGVHGWSPRMTCLTETRLSVINRHARKYGLLGLGFEREFVLRFHGTPVHYVRGRPPESLMEDLTSLTSWLSALRDEHDDPAKKDEILAQFHRAYHLLALTKPMTDAKSKGEDFELLHEHEWRIVQTESLKPLLRCIRSQSDTESALWAVPIAPADLRFLVFPDAGTRELAMEDERFQAWCGHRAIPMLTLQEAEQL